MSTVWIAALVLLLAPAGLAFADGGDDAEVTAAGAGVTLAALALLALFSPAPLLRGRPAVVALGALVGLAVLTAASLSWTRVSAPAGDDLLRLVFYASAFAVALIVLRHPGPRQAAVPVLLATCVAVALYALAARLAPSSLSIGLDFRAGPRVHQPIPYWNAMGIHTAFGILLALAVASDPRRSPRAQALACACVPGFGLVLYLTFSRGALLALAAGLAALLLLHPARATVIAAALSLAAAAVAVAGSRLVPAVVDLEAGAPAPSAAGAVLVGTLVAAAGAGAALGFRRLRRTRWSEGEIRLRRPLRLAAGLAVLGAVVVLGGIFAARSDPAQDMADDEARLATVQTNRARYWVSRSTRLRRIRWSASVRAASPSSGGASERCPRARATPIRCTSRRSPSWACWAACSWPRCSPPWRWASGDACRGRRATRCWFRRARCSRRTPSTRGSTGTGRFRR